MGLLDRILGRSSKKEPESAEAAAEECHHIALTARWDDPDDMGHDDKASAWLCAACGSVFSPEEAAELRRTEAERLPGVSAT
jgi:hypothetical protein